MGVIYTSNHPKALWPGVKAWFGRMYDEHVEEYSKIFDRDSSTRAYEERVELTGFGLAPVKNQGGSISYDSETQGITSRLTNVTYALGYVVTMEELQDNLYEMVSKRRSKALAFSMRQTKETVAANILNRGFNSSYKGGDGKELLATDHPTLDGTQSNELTVAADLSEAALEDLLVQIMQAKNSRGLRIALKGDKLIVPPALFYEANRILKSALQNDTANNAINALKATNALPGGIVLNHYLTDTDAWFIKTNCPEGLIYQERMAMEFEQDNDFDTKNAKAAAVERYAFGWCDFRSIFGSPGA
jgi:phage major head subunit gpT-like protein